MTPIDTRRLNSAEAEMRTIRIALANLEFPASPDDAVALAERAIADASAENAEIVCFPECFVPGYRCLGDFVPPPDAQFLERAWSAVATAAANATGLLAKHWKPG